MSELRARLDVPSGADAPRGARKTVRQLLTAWGFTDGDWLDVADLVVSELVANAVRHGGGLLDVAVQAHENKVTISAADSTPIPPRRRTPDDTGGYGLALIDNLSAGWGVEDYEHGKRVWVRLRSHPTPPRPVT
ncbi:MAG: ATP-binding protein [Hamadaea sp.]|uniref:ATP-binding protein n=1 Tax=Hamadaea sp. TaxID=2024425 RepID=UPI00183B1552|nr:ATP-binding protein [Hamadaea sp.]NUR70909.1 ATP-binding protein [Hamadaea sp.]NUT21696.1 ATP-binding protein [Hamadaea sp.]